MPNLKLVAVNDLAQTRHLEYLLRYDTVYGRFKGRIDATAELFHINEHVVRVLNEKNPERLPWEEPGVETAVNLLAVRDT